ncbi:hypothetical protein Gotri_025615, partial [Gossypium trilobum]|nr:hypothetical protein [Gossypium trilobum]
MKGYPSEITLVSLYCLFGTIQSTLVTLIIKPILFQALVGNVVTFGVQAWCIRRKWSVFVATFKPLSIFVAMLYIAAFLGFILLRDDGEEGIGENGERARV